MSEILLLLLFNSLLIFGFHFATQFDGWEDYPEYIKKDREWSNILWWVRYYGVFLPDWIQKPLYSCVFCMSSIHGSYVFTLYCYLKDYPIETLWLFPFYCLALCGVNLITYKFIDK